MWWPGLWASWQPSLITVGYIWAPGTRVLVGSNVVAGGTGQGQQIQVTTSTGDFSSAPVGTSIVVSGCPQTAAGASRS